VKEYNTYLDLFAERMLPALQKGESANWEDIRALDAEIDTRRQATLVPLNEIIKSLEQESVTENQDQNTLRDLDAETDILVKRP